MSSRQFTTKEFAELVGREPRTLYSWQRTGKLIPKKDFSGRYVYTEEDYEKVMNQPLSEVKHPLLSEGGY